MCINIILKMAAKNSLANFSLTLLKTSRCLYGVSNMSNFSSKVIDDKFDLPKRFAGSEKSVWIEYAQLAAEYKPVNLGQGFPDFPPPKHVTDALTKVATGENCMIHQYTRGFGHLRLVTTLSKLYSGLFGREIDPETEILTTLGAYEALYSTITGHVDEGDEVILIEPFFDCYEPLVKYAGGVPKYIPLRMKEVSGRLPTSADFILDKDELEGLFNSKTKAIILNSPNNPLGKVYTLEELMHIASLCKKYNVLCISDEVYEWVIYKPNEHIRIATLPEMWDRTITIGSAGKSFNVTGWRVGWAFGPANLMENLQIIHQNSVFTGTTPLQEAVAIAFETETKRFGEDDCYFVSLAREMVRKRDYMAQFLIDAGMRPIIPEGGFFMVTDWSPMESQIDLSSEKDKYKDYRFTKWMTKNIGLQGIPLSVFYSVSNKYLAENFVRYCFVKRDEYLKEAADILKKSRNN